MNNFSRSDALTGITVVLILSATIAVAIYLSPTPVAERPVAIPAPTEQTLMDLAPSTSAIETAVFAGGCFWGIQAIFQHTQGVTNAVSGYAGGKQSDADYQLVSGGGTDHAEAVQVSFDPKAVSYGQLLQIFFSVAHDPTQLNGQYPDLGAQYRSAVFYHNAGQKIVAERYIAQLEAAQVFPRKIVTQVNALNGFFPAEKYHQNYAALHPGSSYIAQYDLPKIANFKSLMPTLYRDQAILVED